MNPNAGLSEDLREQIETAVSLVSYLAKLHDQHAPDGSHTEQVTVSKQDDTKVTFDVGGRKFEFATK